ncbi:MAG: hypothetical protein KGY41_01715 [Desulfovermiculus sp.]|nr:hypothetical protein [Desulfovermiculus sp.]
MFRYAFIIVGALILGVYILVLASRGTISGRFRTVSLILLCLFLLLAGVGLYTTQTQYSVQSVQEEYSSQKNEILDQLSQLYASQEYSQARELAERYLQVNDPRLDEWYQRSREAELLQQIQDIPETAYEDRLDIWKELLDLTGKDKYASRVQNVRAQWREFQESMLRDQINRLPDNAVAQKALGYELLMDLAPDRVLYKERHRTYVRQLEEKIEATPWSNHCASRTLDPCQYFGYKVASIVEGQNRIQSQNSEICGVSWRPRGTLITRDGQTAPENGTYFLVHDWQKNLIVLINTAYVQAEHPFPEISPRLLESS